MKDNKKTGRLVAKPQFAFLIFVKGATKVFGAGLTFFGVGGAFLFAALGVVVCVFGVLDFKMSTLMAAAIPFAIGAFLLGVGHLGKRTLKQANNMEPIVPMTRYNIEQLPAEESLVRPSSATSLPPETVLLRAAWAEKETPAEELLRPQL